MSLQVDLNDDGIIYELLMTKPYDFDTCS
jgi:hypothetical protein